MDRKITRRVVLGTAIAGLVAGPFVIRAMKGKQVELTDDYGRLWKYHLDRFSVPTNVLDVVEIPQVKFAPAKVGRGRLLTLTGQFGIDQGVAGLCGAVTPAFFSVCEAGIRADATGKYLRVSVDARSIVGCSTGEELRPVVPVLLFSYNEDGSLLIFQENDDGEPVPPRRDSKDCAGELATFLFFELPQAGLSFGSKWMQPVDIDVFASLPSETVGVCSVQGVEAIKIVSSAAHEFFQPMPAPPVDIRREQLAYYEGGQIKGSCSAVWYVGVETGLLIRQEVLLNAEIRSPKGTISGSSFALSQVFFS